MTTPRIFSLLIAITLVVFLCGPLSFADSDAESSGLRGQVNRPDLQAIDINAQESTNWSGYGIIGGPLGFNSVQGTWRVPTISASKKDTASSTWAGVGGGCTDSSCTTQDQTLIQAGTEQDSTAGKPTYYAWWEALPAPSVQAGGALSSTSYPVHPGDMMTVNIAVSNSAVWTIQITDGTSRHPKWTFSTTVPYSAAGLTAEWIEESPLTAGAGGAGQITLSNFHRVGFGGLSANGANPHLIATDQIIMTDGSGHVLARPSAPKRPGNAFSICYGSGPCF